MLDDTAFWRDLQSQFRALPDPRGELGAILSESTWLLRGGGSKDDERQRLQSLFKALAVRGSIAADGGDCENGLDRWLELLRKESPHFHVLIGVGSENVVTRPSTGGYIENLCLASAEFCVVCETLAFASQNGVDVAIVATPTTNPQFMSSAAVRVAEYKRELKAARGIKVTDAMIAQAANPKWNDRTPVTRFKSGKGQQTDGDRSRIEKVLRERPHLK